jgi:hypothetical protein
MTKNGNGHQHIKLSPNAVKTDASGNLVIDDLVPASVLLMFFIQKLGKCSMDQLADKLVAAHVIIDAHLLENAVQALQARGFVSYAKGKTAGTGEVVDFWKARKANFASMPDVAQVSQSFLSELVSTDDAEELIGAMNESEREGDGKAKAKEKLGYTDYYGAEILFRTVDNGGMFGSLLGGHPTSSFFDKLVAVGPKHPKDCDLRFPRDSQGRPVIPNSNIKGWLEGMLRSTKTTSRGTHISPTAVQYLGIRGGVIEFKGSIDQYAHQVVDLGASGQGGGGRGITTYEIIPAGATIRFWFSIPKRGMLDYPEFVAALIKWAGASARGLSNAKSSQHGSVEVIEAKYLGESADPFVGVRSILDRLSPEARAVAEGILAESGSKTEA